mmetsp:Transcript_6298/g.13326  ORF Transcript_6298/g.13326 Transcript_6298/m.13326 type:complete len:82 (-) Transcript_6298:749-994(-)
MFGETKWGEQDNVVASMEAVDFILVQGFRVSSELIINTVYYSKFFSSNETTANNIAICTFVSQASVQLPFDLESAKASFFF